MKNVLAVALASACLTLGAGVGYAAKAKGPGMALISGKEAKEAAYAALAEAERLAESGSWELLAVARVYYASGDKARGQAIIDRVMSGKSKPSDWYRVARIYAEAGENAKAEEYYQRAITAEPNDDTGLAEVGAWYIRNGDRERGEALLTRAFARNDRAMGHYVRAAEGLLNVSSR
jgi:Tfp pilus assembly protein PilF